MPAIINRAKSFRDDESGSMVLFAIYCFCAMLLLGGLALTVTAHEATRLRLQNTIDMAVLAAADLNQELDPTEVVVDYFAKAKLTENLKRVQVTESLNSREVLAEAEMAVDTMLLSSITSKTWTVNSIGAAREDISNIEVSMVLDTSGSMRSYGRMAALKDAAKNFVDDILLTSTSGTTDGEVSINLIPYSTQVSMPQTVLDQLPLDHRQSYSGCVDFIGTDFMSTALPTSTRSQTAHFDPTSKGVTPSRWICAPAMKYESLLFSQNAAQLKAKIDAMEPYRNTSIDLGLKWGAALLDPSAQGIVDAMIDEGTVDAEFSGRPYEFTQANKMKILVVMTDGENTTQYQLDDSVASGTSDVWEYNGAYSVFSPEGNLNASLMLDSIEDVMPTWWNGTHGGGITGPQYGGGNGNNGCGVGSGWNNGNYKGGGWNNGGRGHNNCGGDDGDDGTDDDDAASDDPTTDPEGPGEEPTPVENFFIVADETWQVLPTGGVLAENIDWQELWANYTLYKQSKDFRYDQNRSQADFDEWYGDKYTTVGKNEKDQRMADICTAAKNAGILVFAIGFEISNSNAAKMRSCASSENHYFDVDNNTIDLAFAAIANSINHLRLVQ